MGEPGSSEEISSKMRVNALSGFSEPASQCNAPENAKVKLTVNFSYTIYSSRFFFKYLLRKCFSI